MSGYLSHRPSPGRITHQFGAPPATPTSPPAHLGQDYGWGNGYEVRAARAGRVTAAASAGAYGNRVIIDHGGGIQTWYCHLSRFLVRVGDQPAGGQDIGVKGATGNVTATHLHFELRIDGRAVDPEPYFTATAPAGGGITPIGDEIDMATLPELREIVNAAVHEVRKDINYMHVVSPYSLKAIRAAIDGEEVELTDAQTAELSARLVEGVVAALPAAVDADVASTLEGIRAALEALPAEVRAEFARGLADT
jgi:murein DD-endopeptidase MepM/ murein hydrolase activator NlpD